MRSCRNCGLRAMTLGQTSGSGHWISTVVLVGVGVGIVYLMLNPGKL